MTKDIKIIISMFFLFLIPLFSATVSCSPSSIFKVYEQNTFVTSSGLSCSNDGNTSVSFTKNGDFFSIDELLIGAGPSSKTITVTFDSNKTHGSYSGSISLSDGSPSIPISVLINEPEPSSGCRLIELPHTTNYRINQGEKGASNQIRVKVSTDCTKQLSMSVAEETQMSKPMFLQGQSGDIDPGGEFSFSIGLNAESVSTGTYQNSYTVVGFEGDNIYSKKIPLSTTVSSSVSPVSNNSFSDLPDCSLESELQLNNTYSMICQNENPNIQIEVLYNPYFKGVSVSETAGKFEYKIQPIKIGNTEFIASFKYKDFVIGNPFIKSLRISKGSLALPGVDLKVIFYQNDIKKSLNSLSNGDVRIVVVDNRTDSTIEDYNALLNGISISNNFSLEPLKDYELRITAPSFNGLVLNLNVSQQPINFQIIPNKINYFAGDTIELNSSYNDTIYLFDDVKIESPYRITGNGNHTIKAVKEGYLTTNKTINVIQSTTALTSTPELDDWKNGDEVIIKLSKNISWEVFGNGTRKQFGNGNLVEFKIDDVGSWEVKDSDGRYIIGREITRNFIWYNPLTWRWYYGVGSLTLIILMGYLYYKNGNEVNTVPTPYS